MEINRGLSLDGYIGNKSHGSWEHAKNILLANDYKSATPDEAFSEINRISEYEHVIIASFQIQNRIVTFFREGISTQYSKLTIFDLDTNENVIIFRTPQFLWSVDNPIDLVYTFNDDGDLILVWCDGTSDTSNRPMIVNVDTLSIDVRAAYQIYDLKDIYLFNDFIFANLDLTAGTGGSLQTGVYFATCRFKLNDGSTTAWNPISREIVIGKEPDEFNNNSLNIALSELNLSYNYLDIAIISVINGSFNATLYEDINIDSASFTHVISKLNDNVIDYTSILVNPIVYNKVATLALANKRLYLGDVTNFNTEINYQRFANDIRTTYNVRPASVLNNNPVFEAGETYAFNIHFIEKHTGNITKGFHIPGRNILFNEPFDEKVACRDPKNANFYHNFGSNNNTVYTKAAEQIPRKYLQIPSKYFGIINIQLDITIDGVLEYSRVFGTASIFENYINEEVINFNTYYFEESYLRIVNSAATGAADNNGKPIEISITGLLNGNPVTISDDMEDLSNTDFMFHGGYYNTAVARVLQYWENKNEEYPVNDEIYFPEGKVRHHRFPALNTLGITPDTNRDIEDTLLYPVFENIFIPQYIADKIDGYIISYSKRDANNRTCYGLASAKSLYDSPETESITNCGYFAGMAYQDNISNKDAYKRDNTNLFSYKLNSPELQHFKLNPEATHIFEIGYIYESFSGYSGIDLQKEDVKVLGNYSNQSFRLKDIACSELSNIDFLDNNSVFNDLINEFCDSCLKILTPIDDTLFNTFERPYLIDIRDLGSTRTELKTPVVSIYKQIDDLYSLSNNTDIVLSKTYKVDGEATYNTINEYTYGDTYVHTIRFADRASLINSLLTPVDYLKYLEGLSGNSAMVKIDDDNNGKLYPLLIYQHLLPYMSVLDLKYKSYKDDNKIFQILYDDLALNSNLASKNIILESALPEFDTTLTKKNDFLLENVKTKLLNYNLQLPNAVIWSDTINSIGNNIINLKTFKANNIYYMPTEYRNITALFGRGRFLFIQQQECLHLTHVKDVIKTNEGDTYLGSGDIFDRLPGVIYGTNGQFIHCYTHTFILQTPYGFIIIDPIHKKVYIVSDSGAQDITILNAEYFFKDLLNFQLPKTINSLTDKCVKLGYNDRHKSIYIYIKDDSRNVDINIAFNFKSNTWLSFYDWKPEYMITGKTELYSIKHQYLYKHFKDNPDNILTYYRNSYADNTFVTYSSLIDIIFAAQIEISKIWDSIIFNTNVKDINGNNLYDSTIDAIMIYNDDQCTGELDISNYHGDDDWWNINKRNVKDEWQFNNFRDSVINNKSRILDNNKEVISNNVDATLKDWWQFAEIISKYIAIRLRINNTSGNKIVINNVTALARKYNR